LGKDSVVTLHLCLRIDPNIKVFVISTPFWFQETREYGRHLQRIWNLNATWREAHSWRKTISINAPTYYEEDVEKCCQYYKVDPTKEVIRDWELDAWISGLRNTEGHTRKFLDIVEDRDGLIKINPILKWTESEVWLYHATHEIPVHPLYARGYRSLGCEPCSKPYTDTERGGRWVGTDKCGGECGIHTQSLKQ
jgi:phosphoadenosine phosphosulfate reductase